MGVRRRTGGPLLAVPGASKSPTASTLGSGAFRGGRRVDGHARVFAATGRGGVRARTSAEGRATRRRRAYGEARESRGAATLRRRARSAGDDGPLRRPRCVARGVATSGKSRSRHCRPRRHRAEQGPAPRRRGARRIIVLRAGARCVPRARRRRRLRRRGRRQLNFHARHRHDGRTDRVRPLGAARARRRHARPHVPAVRCGVRVRLRVVLPMRRRPGRRPDGEALDAARLVQVRAPRRERRRAGERRRQRTRRRPRGRRARGGRSAALRDIETGCCVYLCPGRQLSVPPPRAARASPA